jgi:HEAT repeat protein
MRPLRSGAFLAVVFLSGAAVGAGTTIVQEKEAPVPAADLQAAINRLGAFDHAERSKASRTVRRAEPPVAVPALIGAVTSHTDGYVRYRALVLLTGFNDPRGRDIMRQALKDPNDRLRGVAYKYFEYSPDPLLTPQLLDALKREESEFVRPSLVRALTAAAVKDANLQTVLTGEADRGMDFFRAGVIEALGDYRAVYALEPLTRIAKQEGPLQDDAALALGKIGDKRALETLAGLQRTAPRASQPTIAAAICLLGVNCSAHLRFLDETIRFGSENTGYQELVRSAASGLGAVAAAGNADALKTLLDLGGPSKDPVRAAVALALGTVAMRNTSVLLQALERRLDLDQTLPLLLEAFDMLEEDFEEERFFATVRRTYWESTPNSGPRIVAQALIGRLEF